MNHSSEVFLDRSSDPSVRGSLHRPAQPNGDGLILTHGAGSNSHSPLLIALADVFSQSGFLVLRCDLPYRQVRPYGPPRPGESSRDRAGLLGAVGVMRKMASRGIFLGGHSYGGRQCSILAAENPDLVEGLLLSSYPLHPPGKPQQLRTQHLPNLRTPALFVHGTRDPFGSIEEMEQALKLIPVATRLLSVEAAGHDLGFKGKQRPQDLPERIRSEFLSFFHK
jgi:hypothetical protein